MKNESFYDIIDQEILDILRTDLSEHAFCNNLNADGKKSYAFLYWFLKKYYPNQSIEDYTNLITEGNDDSSCDIIFKNTDQQGSEVFYVVQAKWFKKTNINKSNEITKEIKACFSDFRLIKEGKKKLSTVNESFNANYSKFLEHKIKNGKVKFIFLALCKIDSDLTEYIEDFTSKIITFDKIDFFTLKKQYIDIEFKGLKTHNPIETPYIPKGNFILNFEKNNIIELKNPFPSNIFLIRPEEIFNLYERYGQSLFHKNIRNPLPKSYYNQEIFNTIKNNPKSFWYFNNGITIITDRIEDFDKGNGNVTLKGVQVINGAQTVYSIYSAYNESTEHEKNKMDNDGLISVRVITTGGQDFDLNVTRYTNSQNKVEERDFHSNDEIQINIQNKFLENTNIWYEIRRGEYKKNIRMPSGIKKVSNEIFGQTYLAYFVNDPLNAKNNKKDIFYSIVVKKQGLYEKIFNENTKYDDLLISYYLFNFIEDKRKEIKSKIDKINSKYLTKKQKELLEYDFIQYANFDILALFKTSFYEINKDNLKSINGKIISSFESKKIDPIIKNYELITEYIKVYLAELEKDNPRIIYSVVFKDKNFYIDLNKHFISYVSTLKNKDIYKL